jgi:hypothetical protein
MIGNPASSGEGTADCQLNTAHSQGDCFGPISRRLPSATKGGGHRNDVGKTESPR